jgi:prolipoprotein diacylglyceryltransferase
MSEKKLGNAIFGGVIGLILGAFLGEHRVAELASEEGSAVPGFTGDPAFYLHSPRFWIVLVICTLAFAFIAGRIGRPTSHSDM